MISGSVWNSRSSSRARRIASSHSGAADLGGAAARRIALVEDQVDHRRDGGEPLGALDRARRLERHVGLRDARLGAGDALLHRGFADQEGARDLLDGQAGDDAQRQRDLLGRRQVGMAADEQQPQDVVAVMRAVEPFGQLRPRRRRDRRSPASSGSGSCLRLRRTSSIATLRPTMISQAAGSRGGPFCGQVFSARRQAS